jgi:hypothetical protein
MNADEVCKTIGLVSVLTVLGFVAVICLMYLG